MIKELLHLTESENAFSNIKKTLLQSPSNSPQKN